MTDYDPRLAGGRRLFGMTVPMELRIVLDGASHEMQQLDAYCHEVVEVLNGEYQLELEHDKITVLGSAITQILVDNAQAIHDLLTDLLKETATKKEV